MEVTEIVPYDVTEGAGGTSEGSAGEAEAGAAMPATAAAALGTKTGALRALGVRVDMRVSKGDALCNYEMGPTRWDGPTYGGSGGSSNDS